MINVCSNCPVPGAFILKYACNGTFTFTSGTSDGTVDFVDANADRQVQIGELTVVLAGVDLSDGDTAAIIAGATTLCTDSNKGNPDKGASKINCDDVTDVDAKVTVQTRESPGMTCSSPWRTIDAWPCCVATRRADSRPPCPWRTWRESPGLGSWH